MLCANVSWDNCTLLSICTCIRTWAQALTVFVFVLDDNMLRPRCHVSPYAQSTVALARGIFISLCVGLFIGSQALSQMCTATVPPAWAYCMLLLLLFLLFTNISPSESSYHKTSWPPKHHGYLVMQGQGGGYIRGGDRWVNMVQGLAAEKEQLRSGVMYSAVSSQLSLVFVISLVSLWLRNIFISLLSCKTQRE